MSESLDDNYRTPEEPLWEAVSRSNAPMVVRINETYENDAYDDAGWFQDGVEIMVEGKRTIPYARIRVLDVHNEKQAQKAHYDEFVAERQMFLDQEYLVPLQVPLKLKMCNRPGKPTRYTSIAQVIEDMPRKLLVLHDVISIPPGGSGMNTLVPANTVLTVKRVFTCSIDEALYLQCSFQSQYVSFKDTLCVHFSAIDDDSLYTMHYLQMANVFPTVFEFQHPKPDDVVHYVNYEANSALIMAEGPLEMLGIEKLNVVVAWKRQHEAKSYSTLVIPESRARTLMVQKRHFDDQLLKTNYIQRKYAACTHLDFVSDRLYMIPQDPPNAVCLKSPNLFFFDRIACRLRVAKEGITYNPSTGEESDGSDEIPPPIPERIPITCPQALENAKKKMSLFHSVHKEIKTLFKRHFQSPRRKQREKTTRIREPCNPLYRRSTSVPDLVFDKSDDKFITHERLKKYSTMGYRRPPAPPPDGNEAKQRAQTTTSVSATPSRSKSDSSCPSSTGRERRPLPEIVSDHSDEDSDNYLIPTPTVPPRNTSRSLDSHVRHRTAPPIPNTSNHGNHGTPPSVRTTTNAEPRNIHATLPETTLTGDAKNKVGYATILQKDMQHILCPGQTSEDFYKLSVVELSHLLKYCNLNEIANICYEQRFDGCFFSNIDIPLLLKEPPFNATEIQILKFKKLQDGWRPNLSE